MPPARPVRPGRAPAIVTVLVPQDPQWLHDFYMTNDRLLAPYHAAWAARENGVGEHIAPAYPPGLENLTGLDAPTCLDAWGNVHRAFPPALRSRRCLRGVTADPARGSALRAPDGTPLIPLHPVTVTEQDLRALKRVRRALRAGAKANPSLLVTHHPDGSADIESVPSPGAYAGTVDRTVAVLTLAPDQDVATLAAALTPDRCALSADGGRAGGARRVTLTESEYAAYDRFADRLAAAAMTGEFMGDRALFRSRY
ncbi:MULTISPECIES: hypothetical protein [Streptomyces]|uniref:Uncharacterized protein n=2 Tax=Streptomyces scabiei TaxID=1930 RepID=C9YW87_STRSW|nr:MULTISPECIES: hypothetical protein [Streptomyces]MBP5869277.1 hypothetical protein [Streptomyces sp. LBUM 1485]KFG08360.1 hypothetical protein IQ61_14525 [Streptomyces scabiei]MBP5877754.1 hypothetical protein [Streptomyces sp. LBUM 1477]MBP5885589.1 hypothetical protein [Streptomyces sp. LBUM 1487]MBP5891579.1 hypothetical protein [Streptomyces sp. LBUM 1481]